MKKKQREPGETDKGWTKKINPPGLNTSWT